MPKLYGFPDPRLYPEAAEQFETDIFVLLSYNPDTGHLIWRKAAQPHKARTGRAGSKTADGTIVVTIKGRQIPAQYAAWLLHYGEQPKARLKSRKSRSNLRIANWYEEELSTHPSAANQRRLRGLRRDARTDARMEGWTPSTRPKAMPTPPPQPTASHTIKLYWHAWQPTGDRWKSYSLSTEPPPRPLSRRRPTKGVLAEIVLAGPELHTFTATLLKDAIPGVPAFRRAVHYAGRGAQQLMEHIAKHLAAHDTAAVYPNIGVLPPSAIAPKIKSAAAEQEHHHRTTPRRLYRTLRGAR